jgi:murein DD-endopeptidase MepM/ murein hydrolase activator NlpD
MNFSPLKKYKLPIGKDHPGNFGAIRKYDVHTGIDLYCEQGSDVYAIEDGMVVKIDYFTGPEVNLPWWETTFGVMIEGKSGVINYGEIYPECILNQKIFAGQKIGYVIPVLKENKIRKDIKNHSNYMLHLELYKIGFRDFLSWNLNEPQPENLLNPTGLLSDSLIVQ